MSKKNYWFARKKYGYGWSPSTWQGWLTILIYFLLILIAGLFLAESSLNMFMYIVIVATISLLALCGFKGPTPKWQWGDKIFKNDSK